jgi:hypothetical protein
MTKLIFERWQKVEVELKREPTQDERKILLGKDEDNNMFSLPDDLIDWDTEEAVEEDYSAPVNIQTKKPYLK